MEITLDEGYSFGLGAFETIAVKDGKLIFLDRHLRRLDRALHFLKIGTLDERGITEKQVIDYVKQQKLTDGACKLTVSKENVVFQQRQNPYTDDIRRTGFVMDFSSVRRNETSPLTAYKTLNCGDCILENRQAHGLGMNERIFLNTKGQISEGCTTNIFFIQDDKLVTPPVSSGMLPGVMRRYVIKEAGRRGVLLEEKELYPEDISKFNGCFVTNSLLGMMPAASFGEQKFDTVKVLHFIEQIL
mgnify:FL=1